jgi:uncharacterized repeat protein (TIGR01451 family)
MRIFFILLFSLISFCDLNAQSFTWANKAGSSSNDYGKSIAVDQQGNSYVTGSYSGNIAFGAFTLTSTDANIFIAKYNPSGTVLWAKKAGIFSGYVYGISVDESGNCYITGHFVNTATFGATTLTSAGGSDVFIAKYDASGNVLWAVRAGGPSGYEDIGEAIAVDKYGNCYVSGLFTNPISFENITLTGNGSSNFFVAKYNSSGRVIWARTNRNAGSSNYSTGISVDDANNVYVTGQFTNFILVGSNLLYSSGLEDIFIIKYDASGNVVWIKKDGGTEEETVEGIVVDHEGNTVIAGLFAGTIHFGTDSLTSLGGEDAFIIKHDKDGNVVWGKQAGGASGQEANGIAMDNIGNTYITGIFYDSIRFDHIKLISPYGAFIAKYDKAGTLLWAVNASAPSGIFSEGIAVDGSGKSYITGWYEGTGVGAVFGSYTLYNGGLADVFVSSLSDPTYLINYNTIQGYVYDDVNLNCVRNTSESFLGNCIIKAEPGPFFAVTDVNGNYNLKVDTGNYTITQVIPLVKDVYMDQNCPAALGPYNLNLTSYSGNHSGYNFGDKLSYCSFLNLNIYSDRRRRCFRNRTTVHYCNEGKTTVLSAQIKVIYPQYVTPITSNPAWISKKDSLLTYNIGSIAPGQCGYILITDSVACGIEEIRGLTQCTKAIIGPFNTCKPLNPLWDKSDITLSGSCKGDGTSRIIIKNSGAGNMNDSTEVRMFYDSKLVMNTNIKLISQDSLVINLPSEGRTVRLEADQSPYHPSKNYSSHTIEGCGGTWATVSKGFVMTKPQDDLEEEVDISCMEIRDSYDPNDKQVNPIGITTNKYISSNDPLEYVIRFQNTGSDTAYTVMVKDTLSQFLDIASFENGISSHPYTWTLTGKGQPVITWVFNNINLPDSTAGGANSIGYIKFRIKQLHANANGTLINNQAYIYFDYNSPILTNQTTNIVWDTTETDFSLGSGITFKDIVTGITKKGKTNIPVSVYPNPFNGSTQFTMTGSSEKMSIVISDVNGKEHIRDTFQDKYILYNTGFIPGMYFYRIEGENGIIGTGKIIVSP